MYNKNIGFSIINIIKLIIYYISLLINITNKKNKEENELLI